MFAIVSMILFFLAAFGVKFDEVNIAYLAAAFLALSLVFDWRPWTGRINA